MQSLANFLPTGWIMDALHKLMYFGSGLQEVMIHVFALIILSTTALYFAIKKFSYAI
jgi:ABC-type multidrug transport system permease subunit